MTNSEINSLIHEQFSDYGVCPSEKDSDFCYEMCPDRYTCMKGTHDYSNDMFWTWKNVVKKLSGKYHFSISNNNIGEWKAEFGKYYAVDKTPELAICKCALLIKE